MENNRSRLPVIGGLLAAVGAGLCCIGPFILVSIGVSGAWIANLTLLEPYRPLFIFVVVAMFVWGGWKIYRPAAKCTAGMSCSVQEVRKRRKAIFWIAVISAFILVLSPYWIPLFVE